MTADELLILRRAALLAVLTACYLGLAGSTLPLATVQYDELTDLTIASKLAEHPLRGSTRDPSQARLPMYATAVAYRIMQWFNPNLNLLDVLPVSRWISVLMVVVAIWGTAILGSRLFDAATGLLAAALVALSPYMLHFGRDALTQGDAFTSATVILALIAFERFDRKRTAPWLIFFSLCAGLAIASKFTLVFLIPALITFHLVLETTRNGGYRAAGQYKTASPNDGTATISWEHVLVAVAAGLFALLAVAFAQAQGGERSRQMLYLAGMAWVLALLGLLFSLVLAWTPFTIWRLHWVELDSRWALAASWLAIVPLAAATTLALFPEHIFNTTILPNLVDRLGTRDGGSHEFLPTAVASVRLYTGLVLFKLGLPFGIATFIALGWATWRAIQDRGLLLIIVVLFYYALLLTILPLQQPFWLMSIYPLVLLALSAMIVQGLRRRTGITFRWATAGAFVFAVSWLIVGVVRVYPTFGYYGYETIGDRWLGAPSRGYRALVVVTNDGSTEAIDWLRHHVPVGSRVLGYLDDGHVVRYLQDTQPFAFEYYDALQFPDGRVPAALLASADFTVARTFEEGGGPSPASDLDFVHQFGRKPVHEIVRGRGIYRMPVIRIYQRVPDRPTAK